jgi:hypothetical protein
VQTHAGAENGCYLKNNDKLVKSCGGKLKSSKQKIMNKSDLHLGAHLGVRAHFIKIHVFPNSDNRGRRGRKTIINHKAQVSTFLSNLNEVIRISHCFSTTMLAETSSSIEREFDLLCAQISLLDAVLFNHFQQRESPECACLACSCVSPLSSHSTGVSVIDNATALPRENVLLFNEFSFLRQQK